MFQSLGHQHQHFNIFLQELCKLFRIYGRGQEFWQSLGYL